MIPSYQDAFARSIGVPHAYTFWKGRVALYAILRALDIGQGDEVIMPGFTCVVVANAIRFAGATPVYVDIVPGTYNLDPAKLEPAITSRCRAVIVQHSFGIPADLEPLLEIAQRHRIVVIEDCAHALGSRYRGQAVGTFGMAAFFSSQWSKPYTTGLGGVAVTSDPNLADRLKGIQEQFLDPSSAAVVRLRAQYQIYRRLFSPRVYWIAVGALHQLSELNLFVGSSGKEELDSHMPRDATWRMSAFQARIGLQHLRTFAENVDHRRTLAEFYANYLKARGWQCSWSAPKEASSVLLRYPIRVTNKWDLLRQAADARVELGSWFESVLHPIRTALERFGYREGQCPVGERAANEVINLPVLRGVSMREAERIAKFVCKHAIMPTITEDQPSITGRVAAPLRAQY